MLLDSLTLAVFSRWNTRNWRCPRDFGEIGARAFSVDLPAQARGISGISFWQFLPGSQRAVSAEQGWWKRLLMAMAVKTEAFSNFYLPAFSGVDLGYILHFTSDSMSSKQ